MASAKNSTNKNLFLELIKEKIMHDESISITIFKAFTIFGISSAWIFGGRSIQDKENGLYGPASIVVWSYMIAFISLACIMLLKLIINSNEKIDILKNISGIFTIILMIWIITINLKNFKNINMDLVPENYFSYSNWTYLILLVQSIFVFITLPGYDDKNEEIKNKVKQISMLNVVLVFLSFVLVLIQQIILDNFSVDVL